VVKFTLGAWYDKTKVKKLEEKEDSGGPTAKLKKKVNRRTNELERVRDGGSLDHIVE